MFSASWEHLGYFFLENFLIFPHQVTEKLPLLVELKPLESPTLREKTLHLKCGTQELKIKANCKDKKNSICVRGREEKRLLGE